MSEQQEMFFFIADISGYTAYMLKNQTDYNHGTLVVMQLVEALLKEVKMPLEISKLEGDALFLYLLKDKKSDPEVLGKKILHFFEVFFAKLMELSHSQKCQCGGCSNIQNLNLKIVAHLGKASIDKIGSFEELSGVDVIIAHRLLKNKVKEKCYLLMTAPVYRHVALPPEGRCVEAEEEDKDIGRIPVYVYYPVFETIPVKISWFTKLWAHFTTILAHVLVKLGWKKLPAMHNFPPEKI